MIFSGFLNGGEFGLGGLEFLVNLSDLKVKLDLEFHLKFRINI